MFLFFAWVAVIYLDGRSHCAGPGVRFDENQRHQSKAKLSPTTKCGKATRAHEEEKGPVTLSPCRVPAVNEAVWDLPAGLSTS